MKSSEIRIEMSTLEVLKEYLIGDGGYLLNDDNNAKTVMLSGAWGSGKTHFWQNEIERVQMKVRGKTRKVNKYSAKEYKAGLFSKLKTKKKACVYVSLYGKDNIEVIKSEILQKAYSGIKDENIKQTKAISAFGMGTKILAGISIFGVKVDAQGISDTTKSHYDMKKIDDATEFLSDGGLICFDDFERKSKKIDLNDLFGFIAQLAIDMNCKIVIILNSDVFEGEEANVFKTVKEKTVNKFFYFEPTPKELFDSVAKDEKYNKLNDYKVEILKAIEETKELNARIYIQVLDNCLEWIDKGYDANVIRVLSLVIINFMKNHFVFDYGIIDNKRRKRYKITDEFIDYYEIASYMLKDLPDRTVRGGGDKIIHAMRISINEIREEGGKKSEDYYLRMNEIFENNKNIFRALSFYIYQLKIDEYIDEKTFLIINNFVKTGILSIKNKEQLT